MNLDAEADELYGLPLEEFTSARNERVKRARADGDRDVARELQSLRKPTVAAWLTNQLVRAHREEIDALLELGGELREVMADLSGDELRELTKQRRQLVFALVQQARALGSARGQRVTEDVAAAVRETLEATLSDGASAEAVASGRLTDSLRVSGFGTTEGDHSVPVGAGRGRGRAGLTADAGSGADGRGGTVSDLDTKRQQREAREQRERAQRAVEDATKAVERARAVAERAASRLDTAGKQRDAASAAVHQLRVALDEAITDLEAEDQQFELVTQEKDAAEAKLHDANRRLADAEAALPSMPS